MIPENAGILLSQFQGAQYASDAAHNASPKSSGLPRVISTHGTLSTYTSRTPADNAIQRPTRNLFGPSLTNNHSTRASLPAQAQLTRTPPTAPLGDSGHVGKLLSPRSAGSAPTGATTRQ